MVQIRWDAAELHQFGSSPGTLRRPVTAVVLPLVVDQPGKQHFLEKLRRIGPATGDQANVTGVAGPGDVEGDLVLVGLVDRVLCFHAHRAETELGCAEADPNRSAFRSGRGSGWNLQDSASPAGFPSEVAGRLVRHRTGRSPVPESSLRRTTQA